MRILAALSGGVDSAVAAARLLSEGAEVIGVHLRMDAIDPDETDVAASAGAAGEAQRDARKVAAHLDIPFHVLDASDAFALVLEDFAQTYAEGRTPNPCVLCNPRVKFARLFDLARALDASAVATGHYARTCARKDGRVQLLRAKDERRDQSYVLVGLSQEQLARVRFPLGSSKKAEVRAEAARLALPVAQRPDSQDLCFVQHGDYRAFLRERAPASLVPGTFIDEEGRVIGRHDGAAAYTVGQRRGLPAVGTPQYVVAVEGRAGRVHVAARSRALRSDVDAHHVNWVDVEEPEPGRTFRVETRIRYASPPAPSTLEVLEDGGVRVTFDAPAFAPAPGQALVAYRGGAVLCGGTIAGGGAASISRGPE